MDDGQPEPGAGEAACGVGTVEPVEHACGVRGVDARPPVGNGDRALPDAQLEGLDAVRVELAVLGTPVFVKPARLGSSVGIAKVWSEAELGPALDAAFAHDALVIVEAFSPGIEVECSVLGSARAATARIDREIRDASRMQNQARPTNTSSASTTIVVRAEAAARAPSAALASASATIDLPTTSSVCSSAAKVRSNSGWRATAAA